MRIDNAVLSFAGIMVLVSLALGLWVSPYWFILTAFGGANMLQAGFTGFCPAAKIFKAFVIKPGQAFN